MEVIPLTILLSLQLALLFLVFFLKDQTQRARRSVEQEALRPFAEETTVEDRNG